MAPALADTLPETPMAEIKPIRGRFDRDGVFNALRNFYDEPQIRMMQERGVDSRMVFGINSYYMALVKGEGLMNAEGETILPVMPPSHALQHLVVPIVAEAADKSGEKDPSNQIRYSPEALKGKILHKYDEIVLGYTALACSAHCRYCYRLDLFNGSTGKGLVKPDELRQYIQDYNQNVATQPERYPITEVLLSGGDPMVLSNKQLYKYLSACAEAGVHIIRIGTKEMAFRPMRFDDALTETLQRFHLQRPEVHIGIVTHFTHPDEFLERDAEGNYRQEGGYHVWLEAVKQAVRRMAGLQFITLSNQTPMILHVNNDAQVLHLLHRELRRQGIHSKYIFQCREIEGHKAFAVPVEEAWRIHSESQRGLSDACRSRFTMSTEWGKLEIVSVIGSVTDGLIVLKMHRAPFPADSQGDLIIARRNPQALWMSDYEDRIVYDGRRKNSTKGTATAVMQAFLPQDNVLPIAAQARFEDQRKTASGN